MAEADGYGLNEKKREQIMQAHEYHEEFGTVPPIRRFAKYIDKGQEDVLDLWLPGPLKPATKYGEMPRPAGCV